MDLWKRLTAAQDCNWRRNRWKRIKFRQICLEVCNLCQGFLVCDLEVLQVLAQSKECGRWRHTVERQLFCGDERYVALTLIGDLAKRNVTEKHHII
jgi:hypothetical protein